MPVYIHAGTHEHARAHTHRHTGIDKSLGPDHEEVRAGKMKLDTFVVQFTLNL